MFIPLVLVCRESFFTQEQADAVFGPLVLGIKIMWSFFAVTLGFGLICLGLTVMYVIKRRAVKAEIERSSTMFREIPDYDDASKGEVIR